MEKVVLNAEIREEMGKTQVKKLRKEQAVPAVVYKGGKEAVSIKINTRELFEALHTSAGSNVLITLKFKGDKKSKDKTCIIKEIQRGPVKEDILHVDLNEISLTEKIKVKVPVHSHGEAEGVVKDGGVISQPMHEIEIECLPTDIPEKIEVEVAAMKIGDTLLVKDIKVPSGVTVLVDPEQAVFTVVPPAKEEVVEEVPGEETAEPEVISKGKKEEEEIPEAGAEKPKEAAPPKE